MIGYAMCGSFCTVKTSIETMKKLVEMGYELQPIMSETLYGTDTRFGKAEVINRTVTEICKREIIHTIADAEPIGPKGYLDLLLIAPCTGNTLAKLANGITDTSVTMAAKAMLRQNKPVLIALASNDALSGNLSNIGVMRNRKDVYFVDMSMDDKILKPHSLVADFDDIPSKLEWVLGEYRKG